jgi:hypothetical protein
MFGNKCPKCDAILTVINGNVTMINMIGGGQSIKGLTFNCPMCSHVLGCQIDPVSLMQQTVQEVVKQVEGLTRLR